jgi:hypothetical protein
VSFATTTLRVAPQRVFNVTIYFFMTHSGNFWIHARSFKRSCSERDITYAVDKSFKVHRFTVTVQGQVRINVVKFSGARRDMKQPPPPPPHSWAHVSA